MKALAIDCHERIKRAARMGSFLYHRFDTSAVDLSEACRYRPERTYRRLPCGIRPCCIPSHRFVRKPVWFYAISCFVYGVLYRHVLYFRVAGAAFADPLVRVCGSVHG